MKKTAVAILCVLGVCLMQTNPIRKEDYLDYISPRFGEALCQRDFSEIRRVEGLSLLTTSVARGFLSLHTEPSKNYLLFTVYETRLPVCKIYGVGVAGQFFVWSSRRSS
jgi:hypothetical protein